jgi:hypothetical protein
MPTRNNLPAEARKLLKLYAELNSQDQQNLLAFAEFLVRRSETETADESETITPLEPKSIARPAKESVVKAIKRLSASYYMLERDKMLDDTSTLMMAHVIQGRDAFSVINDLEELFEQHYQRYLSQF